MPTTDQRGALRGPAGLNAGLSVDIGAYEASSSYLVTSTAASTEFGTLQTAVGWASVSTNANPANTTSPAPNTVVFAPPDVQTLDSDLTAIGSLVVSAGGPLPIIIDLSATTYENTDSNGNTLPINVTAPANTTLTLNGPPSGSTTLYDLVTSGTVTVQGNVTVIGSSPALVVNSGQTTIASGVTLVTATNAPTILVNGGSLVVRDSTVVQSSTTSSQPAILVAGGSVDLGTAASPGGNTINTNGTSELVHNTTSSTITDTGNTLEVNGAPLPTSDLSFTSLTSSAVAPVYGQSVTLTAAVRAANPSNGTPTGSVDFVDTTTGADLGTVPISNGLARLTTQSLAAAIHAITARYLGDGSFAFSLDTLIETVSKAPLTVTANNSTKIYGTPNPSLSVTFAGLADADTPSSLGGTLTFTTTATTSSPVGTYAITPSGLTSANYAVMFVPGTLTVTLLPGSIYVLSSSAAGALTVLGNASITIPGNLVVDSSNPTSAVSASGNAVVTATAVQVAGGVSADRKCPRGQDRHSRRNRRSPGGAHGTKHRQRDQSRLGEPERKFPGDDQAGHLQPDHRLGQRQADPESPASTSSRGAASR